MEKRLLLEATDQEVHFQHRIVNQPLSFWDVLLKGHPPVDVICPKCLRPVTFWLHRVKGKRIGCVTLGVSPIAYERGVRELEGLLAAYETRWREVAQRLCYKGKEVNGGYYTISETC